MARHKQSNWCMPTCEVERWCNRVAAVRNGAVGLSGELGKGYRRNGYCLWEMHMFWRPTQEKSDNDRNRTWKVVHSTAFLKWHQIEVNCKAAKITKLWHCRVLRRSAIPWPLSPSSFCPQCVSQDYDRMVLTLLTSRFSRIIFSVTHRSGEVPGISCKTYSDGVPWHQLHCSTFQVEAPMLHHKQSPSQVTHGHWGELAPMRWCEEHVSCRVLLPCPAT